MKLLAIIPARGGSKGVPGKNIKLLNGKPLIWYTIEAAKEVFESNSVCVSTDDEKIKEVAERAGLQVPFIRPSELATDEAGSIGVLFHAIEFYRGTGFDANVIVLLQPTSPFRSGAHIHEAMKLFDNTVDMVVSVFETKANPYTVLFEENSEGLLESSKYATFSRRQDCPKVWELNGAIYIIDVAALYKYRSFKGMRIRKYEMDERSSLDIDTWLDWEIAETLIKNQFYLVASGLNINNV